MESNTFHILIKLIMPDNGFRKSVMICQIIDTVTITSLTFPSCLFVCLAKSLLTASWYLKLSSDCMLYHLMASVSFQCCFTSLETIRLIGDGEPRTATSTLAQLLNSEFKFNVALRPQRTYGLFCGDGEPRTATSTFTQLLSSGIS